MFKKAARIIAENYSADSYFDFFDTFEYSTGKCILRISADSDYACYVNGTLAAFGQYACYPQCKIGDEIDISDYVKSGKNTLYINVWYYGVNSFTYTVSNAELTYEIECGDEILAFSSENTLCRPSVDYISGEERMISPQLGLTYHYDNGKYDGAREFTAIPASCVRSVLVGKPSSDILPRPNKKTVLSDRQAVQTAFCGVFKYENESKLACCNMQEAYISFREEQTLLKDGVYTAADGENLFFVIDLKSEVSGFLDLDIEVDEKCRIDIGYGEHLRDGRVRTYINGRNFSCVFDAKKGRNVYMNPFRRFGCRYLQFFVHSSRIKINYAGIRPVVYPLNIKKYESGNILRDEIYSVCQNTLIQCMHEHYEDCPWREQSLYTLDSRNQMLCGYYAFSEYEFPRSCLKLISQGVRPDGLLTLCYPAGNDFPIPAFSLVYFMQMNEYIKYSGDTSLAEECYPMLQRLIDTFAKRIKDGLITSFDEDGIWNFYEWSDTMHGHEKSDGLAEAPLNCFFILALENMKEIAQVLGKTDYEKYGEQAKIIRSNVKKTFFCEKDGLFRSFCNRHIDKYSVLTNALCLLSGCCDGTDKSNILRILSSNGKDCGELNVVANTLSMNCFRFDALLKEDEKKYKDVILDEIDRTYLKMLRENATSFWETEGGEAEFSRAGSLCHGWSALPIYYYETLYSNGK